VAVAAGRRPVGRHWWPPAPSPRRCSVRDGFTAFAVAVAVPATTAVRPTVPSKPGRPRRRISLSLSHQSADAAAATAASTASRGTCTCNATSPPAFRTALATPRAQLSSYTMIAADVPGSNESRMTSMSSSFTRVWALISNEPNPMSSRFSSTPVVRICPSCRRTDEDEIPAPSHISEIRP
jgi:hypothetical protein